MNATVRFDGSTCSYDGPQDVPPGSSIAFTFENQTQGDALLEVGDDRVISLLAPVGSPGHGFSVMIEPATALACGSTEDDRRIAADGEPRNVPVGDDIDVVVTVHPDACDVQVHAAIMDGDTVGFLIDNVTGADGGAYSWLAADGDDRGPTISEFRPTFADATRLWRWEAVDEGDSAFYTRMLSAGKWGVGCWTTASTNDEQVPFNRYLVGTVMEVGPRTVD